MATETPPRPPIAPLTFPPAAPATPQIRTREQMIEHRLQRIAQRRAEMGRAFIFRFQVQVPSPDKTGHFIGWPGPIGHASLEALSLADAKRFLELWHRWIEVMGMTGPQIMAAAMDQLEARYAPKGK